MAERRDILKSNRGAMTIFMLAMLSILVLTGFSLFEVQLASSRDSHYSHSMAQARFLAQSGLQQARYYAVKVDPAWTGTSPEQEMDEGTFEYVTSRNVLKRLYLVTATGYVPNKTDRNKVQYSFSTTFKYSPIPIGIVVLHPTLAGAMEVKGTGSLTISASDGRAVVNSNSASAVSVSGDSEVKVNEMDVVGGISGADKITCTDPDVACVATGMSPVPDPLAWLPEPSAADYGASKGLVSITNTTKLTITPGLYDGIVVAKTAELTMEKGNYYIQTGGFTTSDTAKLFANEVFIYNDGTKAIDLSSEGYSELSPPLEGQYAGVLFMQKRTSTTGMKLTASGGALLGGAFYTRDAQLELTGKGTTTAVATGYVLRSLKVTGQGDISIIELPDP